MSSLTPITAQHVTELAGSAGEPCISLYIPTFRAGQETRQSPIHLKNLLTEAERDLSEKGLRWDDLENLLGEVRSKIEEPEFWQHQGDGLAVFINSEGTQWFELPYAVEAAYHVGPTFDITGLLPMLSGDGRYYLLAVSQNDVRLFDAMRHKFTELDVEGLPKGMDEALWADDPERQLQFHSGAGANPGGGGRSAMFYGTGDEGNMEQLKVDYKRYFDKVDAALSPLFKRQSAPVVLAGVGYLLPIYRQANTSARLLDAEIHGNKDRATAEDLHQASWEAVAPHFEAETKATLDRFHAQFGTGLASADLPEVTQAAQDGRVDALLVSQAVKPESRTTANTLAIETLQKGGTVLTLPPDQMPNGGCVAAIYRY